MSTPNSIAPAGKSMLSQVQDVVVSSANWAGRQVTWVLNTSKNFLLKIIEFVRPFFSATLKFVSENLDKAREIIASNKELVGYLSGTFLLAVILTLGCVHLCGGTTAE